MRCLLVLLALLVLAPAATAKPGHGETTLTWLSAPDGATAGGTWVARFRVDPQGPIEPRVVVRDDIAGVEHHYLAAPEDGGVYSVRVPFPHEGTFIVEATGFDAADPERFAGLGPPVTIGERAVAPAGDGGVPWWPFLLAAALAVVAWRVPPAPHSPLRRTL